jgi:hypothetical protein
MATNLVLTEGDISPGTLYYLRAWRVDGDQLRIASYRAVDGQIWWVPDGTRTRAIAIRALAVLVGGAQVAVRSVDERLTRPARLLVELEDGGGSTASGPTSRAASRWAEIPMTRLVKRLAEGWEVVDATLVED